MTTQIKALWHCLQGCALRKIEGSPERWNCKIYGVQHMICMKEVRFFSRPTAKVRSQGPPGSARARPWFDRVVSVFESGLNWSDRVTSQMTGKVWAVLCSPLKCLLCSCTRKLYSKSLSNAGFLFNSLIHASILAISTCRLIHTCTLTLPCKTSCSFFMSGGFWAITLFSSLTLFCISSKATWRSIKQQTKYKFWSFRYEIVCFSQGFFDLYWSPPKDGDESGVIQFKQAAGKAMAGHKDKKKEKKEGFSETQNQRRRKR